MACNSSGLTERLNQIDSLVVKDQYDSAYTLLNNLGELTMTEEDQAHFYLLSTQLGYLVNKPLPSDSLLDLAIAYYDKVGNNHKLAEAYHYKSYRLRKERKYPQAILYGKKAEQLSNATNNYCLKFKIYENLACLNGLCDNDFFQLQYAKRALAIALAVKNNNWIAYSYNIIE